MGKISERYVVVIDDSEWHNILLEKMLEMKGYAVQTFTNGLNLLDHLEKKKPNLIISDINMPEMDGFELMSEIRKIPDARDIPSIYVSSEDSDEVLEQVQALGAVGFVQKPLVRDHFLQTVEKKCA